MEKAHNSYIYSLIHDSEKDLLMSGSWDKTVKVWNYKTKDILCMKILSCGDVVNSICFIGHRTFATVEGSQYGKKQYSLRFWDSH